MNIFEKIEFKWWKFRFYKLPSFLCRHGFHKWIQYNHDPKFMKIVSESGGKLPLKFCFYCTKKK